MITPERIIRASDRGKVTVIASYFSCLQDTFVIDWLATILLREIPWLENAAQTTPSGTLLKMISSLYRPQTHLFPTTDIFLLTLNDKVVAEYDLRRKRRINLG